MCNYRVIVKNYGDFEIYNKIITAKDENEAMKYLINDADISCGDKIEIDYE